VLLLNTAGIIASYKTGLKFHFQSEYLHGDSLQRIVDACHKEGIRVIARTDFSKVRRPVFEQHPEWAYRTFDGKIVDYNGDVHVCLNGAYQQEYMYEIVSEAVSRVQVDGVFCNMSGFQVRDYSYNYHGICHCDSCKKLFRERFGLELPKAEDLKDPVYRKYKIFQREQVGKQNERLYRHIKSINPDLAVNGYDIQRMESNTEYKRPLPHWQYSASSNTRAIRGTGERELAISENVSYSYQNGVLKLTVNTLEEYEGIVIRG
jgi:beta-galactosidase GanA